MVSSLSFARSYLWPGLFVMLLATLPSDGAGAAPALTMTAGLEVSSLYRPDSWQPIRLEFRNDTEGAIDGTAVVPLADPDAPATMTLPVSVPAHSRVSTTIWAYFPDLTLTPEQKRQGLTPPLALAEWRGRDGALLTRAELVGVPLSGLSADQATDGDQRGELILVVGQREEMKDDEPYEATWLIGHLGDDLSIPMAAANVGLDRLPRQAAGLRSLKAVVLEAVDPESLDLAQRAALLDYLHGGGVVVVAAPIDAVGRAGSWFAGHFPVRLVGSRMAQQVETSPGGAALKFRQSVPIIEAIEGDGQVLLRGKDYVHVAVQPVGLGKVVFTSFPLNALAESQPQVAVLWEQLLDVRRPLWEWNDSQLGEARHQVLGAMIGRKVAPWGVAAAVAGGYLLLILAAQAMFFGPARPKAFVASVAAALVVSGGLLAMGMARRGEQTLQAARLTVLDVGADGNGWQQESVAYVGADDPKMVLESADERVMIRPALADAGNRPSVRQQPFAVKETGVFPERIERVWEAAGPADPSWRVQAIGRFGPNGLTLDVDNGLGKALEAPLLVWNQRALAMTDLPTGQSTVGALHVNPRGEFTAQGVLTSEQAKRRGRIIKASLMPANPLAASSAPPPPPLLVGWLAGPAGPGLVRPVDREGVDPKSLVLVRTPLRIEPPAPGTLVAVPAALVSMDTGRLPYDHQKGESIATPQPGEWQVSFAVPSQVGRVRPTRLTLAARVTLPGHSLRLRKASSPGATVAEWAREVGAKEVRIDCSPGDYDQSGRVSLVLEVRPKGGATDGVVAWQIEELGASFEAEVVAPPDAIVLDAPRRLIESRDKDEEKEQ